MIYLHVVVEGDTELNFVKQVLAPHMMGHGIFTDARKVLTSRNRRAGRTHRGGMSDYSKSRDDISAWLKERSGSDNRFTTMFDLYALPPDFPGFQEAALKADPYERVQCLESALAEDFGDWRFVPYIQLHEFEALVLSDPQHLDWEYIDHEAPIRRIVEMVGERNPELIDDRPETAPSKRILRELPTYDKATAGVSVVEHIGLPRLREKCRHFNDWLTRLESLAE